VGVLELSLCMSEQTTETQGRVVRALGRRLDSVVTTE
jgi:hypothetical protein